MCEPRQPGADVFSADGTKQVPVNGALQQALHSLVGPQNACQSDQEAKSSLLNYAAGDQKSIEERGRRTRLLLSTGASDGASVRQCGQTMRLARRGGEDQSLDAHSSSRLFGMGVQRRTTAQTAELLREHAPEWARTQEGWMYCSADETECVRDVTRKNHHAVAAMAVAPGLGF